MIDHVLLASELLNAIQTATPVEFITARHPELTWSDARAIARACDALRRDDGQEQIGFKLGWTSEAMRTALGIDRPNWGTLWQGQCSDGRIDLARLIHPKLEPELVWRCGADLQGHDVSAADVAGAGGEWALGIEVVDPRFASYAFEALDNTADNSSGAAIVVGEFRPVNPHGLLDDLSIEIDDGGEPRQGLGSQAMGSPAGAVAWLVRSLAAEGEILRAGQIVFTGGLTAPYDATRAKTYTLRADGFATAVLHCSD